jgi:tRNA-dihydrouridine synthase A
LAFVKYVSENSPVKHFIIHARKCLLKGLNPKENRTIPPLKYDYVLRLKQDLPHLDFSINGGFKVISQIQEIL